jgi:SOS response regulatory protein OraA/RecX
MLAQRRLTQAQLTQRLYARGYEAEEVREAVDACKSTGYLNDELFARLFVEGRVKPVGDARMVAELVRRGIDREAAVASVADAEHGEEERLEVALGKLFRTRPSINYPAAARALERLGFSTAAIYRKLREHAQSEALLGAASEERDLQTRMGA